MTECNRPDCARPATRRGMCNSCYGIHRGRQIAYGRWEPLYIDASPVRDHVKALQSAGLGLRRIADLAGVSRSQLDSLLNGRPHRGAGPSRRVHRETAAKLLAITLPEVPHRLAFGGGRVPGIGTTRRLRALVSFGYTQSYLCARLGVTPANGTCLFSGTRTSVTAATARKAEALFAELQLTPGPSASARLRGARLGWALPLQWDEDSIDDPAARPVQTTHARGGFVERYSELADLGVGQVECARRLGITWASLVRQLQRHGIAVGAELQSLAHEQRRASA